MKEPARMIWDHNGMIQSRDGNYIYFCDYQKEIKAHEAAMAAARQAGRDEQREIDARIIEDCKDVSCPHPAVGCDECYVLQIRATSQPKAGDGPDGRSTK
jgi:hypothetical protein